MRNEEINVQEENCMIYSLITFFVRSDIKLTRKWSCQDSEDC